MSDSLKNKTINALSWNAFDKIGFQVIALLVGVITARLLSPKDFGLIGALAIFTLISNLLIESGFTSALIRREKNTTEEYTAIFYFNLFLSLSCYLLLFFSAPYIASFFKMPELINLSRFLFLAIIINSLGLIQTIVLTKELAFRTMSIANIVSAIASGIITIGLIFYGWGYWALAWQIVSQASIKVSLLWIFSNWRLASNAHFRIIKEVFSFSSVLLITSFINTIIRNIYNIIIGKFFTIQDLGYYFQANKFQQIPSNVISLTINGVAFPVLSELKKSPQRQLFYCRKILRILAFIIFPTISLLYATASDMVLLVLTEKWMPFVPYFKILLIVGMIYPIHMFYVSIIAVNGHAKTIFLLEMMRNSYILASLFFCLNSIEHLLIGLAIANVLSYITDLFFAKRIMNFTIWYQLKDILPYLVISIGIYGLTQLFNSVDNALLRISFQLIVGISAYLSILYLLKSRIMIDTISLLKNKKL